MKNRQKILLTLIHQLRGGIKRTRLMKLAFLLQQEGLLDPGKPFYDFLPYKFGPYSFTLDRELHELVQLGFIDHKGQTFVLANGDPRGREFCGTDSPSYSSIIEIIDRYGALNLNSLIRTVYNDYPWYAINSDLPDTPKRDVQTDEVKQLYTSGYEGESIDYFLNKLLKAGVVLLIDVRYNPVSRKYGFSKKALSALCGKLRIDYIHVPELGIPSKYRADLQSSDDYRELMERYVSSILPGSAKQLYDISEIVQKYASSLLCFEADYNLCHRSRLAEAVNSRTGIEIIHL